MESLGDSNNLGLSFILVAALLWIAKTRWLNVPLNALLGSSDKVTTTSSDVKSSSGDLDESGERDFVQQLRRQGKQCVVFYGTETGTAEAYAKKLAQDIEKHFQLGVLLADLDDYDTDNLDRVPKDRLAVFVLATAGDGEPTTNAVELYRNVVQFQGVVDLGNLRFAAFGLGNSSYEHYNAVVRHVTSALTSRGAYLIGTRGESDDSRGTAEDDFNEWKETLIACMAQEMSWKQQHEVEYMPVVSAVDHADKTQHSPDVYVGELSQGLLIGADTWRTPPSRKNPHIGRVSLAKELFKTPDRNCIHMEIEIGSHNTYKTGDHIGIWPMNADEDVDALLVILGLEDKRHDVVSFKAGSSSITVPFPTPTTYDAIFRHYLDIRGTVSRDGLARIANFAANDEIKKRITALSSNKTDFSRLVKKRCMKLSSVLRDASGGHPWTKLPMSVVLEAVPTLTPRSYSISSSALESPKTVSITAVVESRVILDSEERFHGVSTNYLLALQRSMVTLHGDGASHGHSHASHTRAYQLSGPRNKLLGPKLPFYINTSSFRPPANPETPIIMVGPGSGVAPFRGFAREYLTLATKKGISVGKMLLFFGCRSLQQDYIYDEEWQQVRSGLGSSLRVIVAPSRDGPRKIYVQDRLREMAATVDQLLQQDAHFYVCGDAGRMAVDVHNALAEILVQQRSITTNEAREILKRMKSLKKYQVCETLPSTVLFVLKSI